jgi:gliding motility-associated-like protein
LHWFCVYPKNLTDENLGSPIFYNWDLGNGQVSDLREPPPQVFSQAGEYEITLKAYTEQCPLPVQTFKRILRVERSLPGIQYPGRFTYSEIPITLEARSIGVSVEWNPSIQLNDPESFTPEFKGKNDQDYEITLTTEGGCITVDRIRVQIIDKADIQVPTAFTPNADGLNDHLRPVLMGVSHLKYFKIFNRWGQLIFDSNKENPGWDGSFKGLPQPAQSYIWMVEGTAPDGTLIQKKGTTVLIR